MYNNTTLYKYKH